MGLRSSAAVALVATALLGFTVAVPQDPQLGAGAAIRFTGKGANTADTGGVRPGDPDLGRLLDRADGRGLDPDLVRNLDRAALASLLTNLTAEQRRSLGLDGAEAARLAASLRDPSLSQGELAALMASLADRGLSFLDADGDRRFGGNETAFADVDGDGKVSAGDVRLGALALLAGRDPGLHPKARALLQAFQAAGGVGLDSPASARDRSNATAATAPLEPLPYPTDRGGGPLRPVCVPLYSPSLTCHHRTFVQHRVASEPDYLVFLPDLARIRAPIPLEPEAPGVRAQGSLVLHLDPERWTPVPSLTPADRLVGVAGPSIELARDGNGMVWARGAAGEARVTLTWAADFSYYDLAVPASVAAQDVPPALRPVLPPEQQAVGLRIAQLAGADGRGYGGGIQALAAHLRSFGGGRIPDRDAQADDLLAVAEAQVGCARHRSQAFVLAAQALGVPARLVLNEAHAFAEVYVPDAGWRMVGLGGCGQYQVAPAPGHAEVRVRQDLPYAPGQQPPSQGGAGAEASAFIDITESPASLRRNTRFAIAGPATSPAGPVPDGVPVTFTYNRTKASPGTAFCSGLTAGGAYRATCQLGPETPGGSLQLVARLAGTVVAGRPTQPAYSDPPFTLQKATRLAVEGPARTVADAPLAYVVQAVDEDGLPVRYAPITVQLDGGAPQRQATDRAGRALFLLEAGPGTHRLQAAFAGNEGHDPANATLELEATTLRLVAQVDPEALEDGTVAVDGSAPPGRTVRAAWRSAPDAAEEAVEARVGSDGGYKVRFRSPAPAGVGLVHVEVGDVGVGAGFTRAVAATATLEAPARWQAGSAVPLTIRVSGSTTPLPLTVLADGEAVTQAMASPEEATTVLVALGPGDHTLAVRPEPGSRLASSVAAVRVGRFEAALDPVASVAPGGRLDLAGTLRFDGEPVAQAVTLRLLDAEAVGRGDAAGRFHLTLLVPPAIPSGRANAVLEAPGGLQQDVALLVQRPARLAIEAPAFTLNAFGATALEVRGEGVLHLRVDGASADPGLRQVATGTLLLRTVRIDAVALPSDDGLAPARATHEILVVNPLTLLGGPALAVTGTAWGLRARRRSLLARARRQRFLAWPRRSGVRILRPAAPPPVPCVLDPTQDDALELRVRRRGPWLVRDGRGQVLPARVEGRTITLPASQLAPGLHQLRLERGRRSLAVPVAVQPLRAALDDATRHLLQRLRRSDAFVTMEELEAALRRGGASAERAAAVRQAAEAGLYAGPRCGRGEFHAFFEALDRAQADP